MKKYTVTTEAAPKLQAWLATRKGVLVWRNQNMSSQSLGSEVFTPATHADGALCTSPGWQYGSTPEAVVTDPSAFVVTRWRKVTRVKVMASKYGPPCDPISRGRKQLDDAMAEAGPGANWRWDPNFYQYGSAWRQAIVEVPDSTIPLADWKE